MQECSHPPLLPYIIPAQEFVWSVSEQILTFLARFFLADAQVIYQAVTTARRGGQEYMAGAQIAEASLRTTC